MADLKPFDFLNPFSGYRYYGWHKLTDFYKTNWNDYEKLSKLAGFSFIGAPARYRRNQMEAEENHRYWNDWVKNTGVRLDDIKYPIRSRIYSDYTGSGRAITGATKSFMNLYKFSSRYGRRY